MSWRIHSFLVRLSQTCFDINRLVADAESACQAEEANLVSIHNDAENSAVLLALEQSGNQPFWIGLHDPQVKILRRL